MTKKIPKDEQLVDIYRKLLSTLNITDDEQGLLGNKITGEPVLVEGRRLALPTRYVLDQLSGDDLIAFHPLSENVFEGISPVLQGLRVLIEAKLNECIVYATYTLLNLVADKASHSKLSDHQLKFISPLGSVDDTLIKNFKKLCDAITMTGNNKTVNIFLKNKGTINDTEYLRVGKVTFPLVEAIDKSEDGTVLGVKFRKKDLPVLKKLFELVIPNALVNDHCSTGSNNDHAPYMMALLRCYLNVLTEIGSTVYKFRSYIDETAEHQVHVSKEEVLELIEGCTTIQGLANAIRPLPYNMGDKTNPDAIDESRSVDRVRDRHQTDTPINVAQPTQLTTERDVEYDRRDTPRRGTRGLPRGRVGDLDPIPRRGERTPGVRTLPRAGTGRRVEDIAPRRPERRSVRGLPRDTGLGVAPTRDTRRSSREPVSFVRRLPRA